jgi:hypothetical protein
MGKLTKVRYAVGTGIVVQCRLRKPSGMTSVAAWSETAARQTSVFSPSLDYSEATHSSPAPQAWTPEPLDVSMIAQVASSHFSASQYACCQLLHNPGAGGIG